MKPRAQTLAEFLSSWRQGRALTQAQAAAELGLSVRTYQEYETGRYEPRAALLRDALLNKVQTSAPKGKS